ncbi:MAG TPA: PAS domain S-box protein, partial [Rhodothermales bacterium]
MTLRFMPIALLWQTDPTGGTPAGPVATPLVVYLAVALAAVVLLAGLVIWLVRRGGNRRESQLKMYRTIFETASEPIVLLDDDLTILETNPAAAAMLGQSADRLKRTRLLNWISPDIEEERIPDLQTALDEDGRTSFWSTITVNERQRNVDVRLSRTKPEEGVQPIIVGLLYDISDYREEGRLFKTLH